MAPPRQTTGITPGDTSPFVRGRGEADKQLAGIIQDIKTLHARLGRDPKKLEGITSAPIGESPQMTFGRGQGLPDWLAEMAALGGGDPERWKGKDTSDWMAQDERDHALWALRKTLKERAEAEGARTDDLQLSDDQSLEWIQNNDNDLFNHDAWDATESPRRPAGKKEPPPLPPRTEFGLDRQRHDSFLTPEDEAALYGRSREKIMAGRDPEIEKRRRREMRRSSGAIGAAAGLSLWSGEMGQAGRAMAQRVRKDRDFNLKEAERPERLRRYDIDTDLGYAEKNRTLGKSNYDRETPIVTADGEKLDERIVAAFPELGLEAAGQELAKKAPNEANLLIRSRALETQIEESQRRLEAMEKEARLTQIAQQIAINEGKLAAQAGATPEEAQLIADQAEERTKAAPEPTNPVGDAHKYNLLARTTRDISGYFPGRVFPWIRKPFDTMRDWAPNAIMAPPDSGTSWTRAAPRD